MLPMHDRTRRSLAMGVFLLFGAAPPIIFLAVGIARKLPTHTWAEERRLSEGLGLDISMRRVKHPRPGTLTYHDVVCRDPETGEEILRSALITCTQSWEILETSDAGQTSGETAGKATPRKVVVVSTPEVVLRAGGSHHLTEAVNRLFRMRAPWRAGAVRFEIEKLVIVPPAPPIPKRLPGTIHRVSTQIVWDAQQADGSLCFALEPQNDPRLSPIFVGIQRRRGETGPKTVFRINASTAKPLPSSLVRIFFPSLELPVVGDPSFAGSVLGEFGQHGWNGQIDGRLLDLDIAYQPAQYASYGLTAARAQIELRGQFARGRLLWAAGWIDMMHGGWIGRDLCESWARRLDLVIVPPRDATADVLPFERFCLRYQLDAKGLAIRPVWDDGVLMSRPPSEPVLRMTRPLPPLSPALLVGDMVPHDGRGLAYSPWVADILQHLQSAASSPAAPTNTASHPAPDPTAGLR